MRFKYKAGGRFRMFVKQAHDLTRPTGSSATVTVLAEKEITARPGGYCKGCDWQEAALTFTVPETGLYRLGVEADFRDTIALYVTDFRMDE